MPFGENVKQIIHMWNFYDISQNCLRKANSVFFGDSWVKQVLGKVLTYLLCK